MRSCACTQSHCVVVWAFSEFAVAVGSAVAVAAFPNRRSAEGTSLLYLSVAHRYGKRKKNVSGNKKKEA